MTTKIINFLEYGYVILGMTILTFIMLPTENAIIIFSYLFIYLLGGILALKYSKPQEEKKK